MALALAILTVAGIQAQENKTVKQESTIKRVVTKQGSAVEVKESKKTSIERGKVIVKDNNQTNQEFNEASKKNKSNELTMDEVSIDENNEMLIIENQKRKQAQLEASIKEQHELAAKRKKEFEQSQIQKQKELEDRKAKLEARPKRMSKLNKN